MKTIEQKAKAYDEAIKKAAALYKASEPMSGCNVIIETLFPELKESEDEKVRKELIKHLKELSDWKEDEVIPVKNPSYYRQWASWLEKQGKETSWKPSKEEMDVLYGLAYITNQYDEHKEEVITHLYQDLKREFFNGSSYENMFPNTEDGVRRRSTIQVLEYARSLDTYNQYGKADIDKNIAWLENQGKKQPIIVWHSINEEPEEMKELFCEWESDDATWHDVAFYDKESHTFRHAKMPINVTKWIYVDELLEKQGEQKHIDKIEPKFKIGDWIINPKTGNVLQIKNVLLCGNKGNYEFDYSSMPIESVDKHYHLWTIEDAKEGDVLCDYHETYDNPLIFILKRFEHVNFGLVRPSDYSSYCFLTAGDIQRFKEGTYHHEHNIKPATKEQRDTLLKAMADAGYTFDFEKKKLKNIAQKTEENKGNIGGISANWSEEDEKMLDSICISINEESIAEALRSRGDSYSIEDLTTIRSKQINWLKSLRPQSQWKPTDEQIECLSDAIEHYNSLGYPASKLKELYEQLKKL